jgi:hypothetical protein
VALFLAGLYFVNVAVTDNPEPQTTAQPKR